jgi:hypothetical protein
MFQRTESLPLELPQEGTLRPRCPKLHRSQSEIVDITRPTTTSPTGPPDITAIDLSADSIYRTHSQADVRPPRSTEIPPLERMVGFGKYRRSIHANPEWQMQQYRANLRDFPGLVPHLGDFKLADPDPVVWDMFCQESARSNSFASSKTSHSTSSDCAADGTRVHHTGMIVTRGFVSSTNSSAASSVRNGSNGHVRKDSGMSMTSPSGESDNKLARFSSQQSTLSILCEPTALPAINEDLTRDHHQGHKIPQILKCDIDGNVENAVESDNEDGTKDIPMHPEGAEVEASKIEALTLRSRNVQHAKLCHNMTTGRTEVQESCGRKARGSKAGLDRSMTVTRKPVKHALRRTMSRGKPPSSKRMVASEIPRLSGREFGSAVPRTAELISCALTSSDKSTEAHENLGDLGPYMVEAENSANCQLHAKEDPVGGFRSESAIHTVTTEHLPHLPI